MPRNDNGNQPGTSPVRRTALASLTRGLRLSWNEFVLCCANYRPHETTVVLISAWLILTGLVHAANPAMPTIPATIFNVTNYGAIGNGVKDNTTNIQNDHQRGERGGRRHRRNSGGHVPERAPHFDSAASICGWTPTRCSRCCLSELIPAAQRTRKLSSIAQCSRRGNQRLGQD